MTGTPPSLDIHPILQITEALLAAVCPAVPALEVRGRRLSQSINQSIEPTPLTSQPPTPASRPTKIQYLDLSGCFMLGDSAIPLALQACPALRSLKLENCRKLTDATLRHVVEVGELWLCGAELVGRSHCGVHNLGGGGSPSTHSFVHPSI